MGSHGRLWFLSMIVLTVFINDLVLSEAKNEKKLQLPSAVVVGTVYCDACFQEGFSNTSHFISGALVAVECGGTSFRRQVETNEKGDFRVHLPFSVSKHAKKIKGCSAKLISSSEPNCAVASPAASSSSSLHLKARNIQGTHVFSAGLLAFKPRKRPELCSQKPKDEFSAQKSLKPTPNGISFPPQLQDPPAGRGLLPPLPELPPLPVQLPPLTPLPAIPGFPPESSGQPNTARKSELLPNGKVEQQELVQPLPLVPLLPLPPVFGVPLPPNPFQPPSVLPPAIPNPLQPSPSILPPIPILQPPPSIFPPNPFQPSPPSFNLPPIPSLFPSPPPPPAFPFPLPPIFPGIPPAAPSSKKTSSSP
ncbi:pollen-specific leucine-rich repeat extensin-like protein 4 [Diospyros lotus]|uniref:pollen-specific leucine-rich repeat extensin-like protein 4 n=1 Tax=Diospyros lotus TaxID=55363 RepID=UPI00224FC6C7|nr:pollen-specific leucine-rich repeat extensin-like protein 4 [Diospyros lotus]